MVDLAKFGSIYAKEQKKKKKKKKEINLYPCLINQSEIKRFTVI